MAGNSTNRDFYTQTMSEFGAVPRRGLIYATIGSVLSATAYLLQWGFGAQFPNYDYVLPGVMIFPWLLASYATAMTMVQKPSSVAGCFKFVTVSIVTFAPMFTGVAAWLFALGSDLHNGLIFYSAIVLVFFGVLFVAFLPAWPIAQAIATKMVSPIQIVEATKGYRWPLVLMGFIAGGMNKFVPSLSSVTNVGEAILFALVGAVVGAATLVLNSSIAVTAWRFSLQRDASLASS